MKRLIHNIRFMGQKPPESQVALAVHGHALNEFMELMEQWDNGALDVQYGQRMTPSDSHLPITIDQAILVADYIQHDPHPDGPGFFVAWSGVDVNARWWGGLQEILGMLPYPMFKLLRLWDGGWSLEESGHWHDNPYGLRKAQGITWDRPVNKNTKGPEGEL